MKNSVVSVTSVAKKEERILMRKHIFIITVAIVTLIASFAICLASTTFETKKYSNYGEKSAVEKLVVTVIPVHRQDPNDHNDVNSVATMDDSIYGQLERITITAVGTDPCFGIDVNDSMGMRIFGKSDISTTSLPLSYNLSGSVLNPSTSRPGTSGILVAGPLTIDTNNVDPVNLTSITVSIYYFNLGK